MSIWRVSGRRSGSIWWSTWGVSREYPGSFQGAFQEFSGGVSGKSPGSIGERSGIIWWSTWGTYGKCLGSTG